MFTTLYRMLRGSIASLAYGELDESQTEEDDDAVEQVDIKTFQQVLDEVIQFLDDLKKNSRLFKLEKYLEILTNLKGVLTRSTVTVGDILSLLLDFNKQVTELAQQKNEYAKQYVSIHQIATMVQRVAKYQYVRKQVRIANLRLLVGQYAVKFDEAQLLKDWEREVNNKGSKSFVRYINDKAVDRKVRSTAEVIELFEKANIPDQTLLDYFVKFGHQAALEGAGTWYSGLLCASDVAFIVLEQRFDFRCTEEGRATYSQTFTISHIDPNQDEASELIALRVPIVCTVTQHLATEKVAEQKIVKIVDVDCTIDTSGQDDELSLKLKRIEANVLQDRIYWASERDFPEVNEAVATDFPQFRDTLVPEKRAVRMALQY